MASSDKPCTLTLPDGTHYDLSSLASAKQDYEATVGDRSYKLNVCRSVVSELWKVDSPELVGGFTKRERGDFSLGQFNDTLLLSESTDQPMMYMKLGSPCPLNPLTAASTAVRFVCSPNDFHSGQPILVAALPPGNPAAHCQFFFEWHTHVACPTNPKAELEQAHYVVFLSILAVALLTYFLGHTLFNRLFLKRRGADQFPFPIPALAALRSRIALPTLPSLGRGRDVPRPGGALGGWGRRSGRAGRAGGGGYSHIRADEDDEEEGFAARFSLEEDEEGADDGPRGLTEQGVRDSVLGAEREAWGGFQDGTAGGAEGTGTGTGTGADGGKGKGRETSLAGTGAGLVDL